MRQLTVNYLTSGSEDLVVRAQILFHNFHGFLNIGFINPGLCLDAAGLSADGFAGNQIVAV